MRTIAEAVREIVLHDPFLHTGLYHRLLNLSQVARFLEPLVAAHTRKAVTSSAILMSLSRLQQQLTADVPEEEAFLVDRISVQTQLCSVTFAKTAETHRALNRLFNRVQEARGYITVTEGHTEITVLIEAAFVPEERELAALSLRKIERGLAGLGVQFREQYAEEPGLLYRLLQQLVFQRINVVEVTSTLTEFTIYVHQADLQRAFDALYHRFARQGLPRTSVVSEGG